jgi:uncharacterized protein (TIGR02001 family)
MISIRTQLAGLALVGLATVAQAGVSVTPALTSDYDFRGITQTANDPAFSVGVDYYTGPVHLGAWTSNVQFDSSETSQKFFGAKHTEIDYIVDYSGGDDKTFKYNFGFVDYTYPGQTYFDFPELWVTLSKGWLSGSLHYSWDWNGASIISAATGGPGASAYYVELNGSWPIGGSGFAISAHAGDSWGDYWDNYGNTGSYQDYNVGLTKSFGNFNFALKYIDTSSYWDSSDKKPSLGAPNEDVASGKGRAVLSVSTTLPWASK